MKMFMQKATDAIRSGEADMCDVMKKMKKIKMFMAFKDKMEKTKCFLKAVGWVSVNEETHEVVLHCHDK